ncbi:uncharacterized protein LOC120003665 [Tripterygium wilfordii]|uniref:uncharacterized protein LOC120003665 n=1 Tax=Tripterygium wilfordii TaxID=458696 RepID=UPI0018F7F358|nr:uncharacterized protein LOC120003665 [Tripterygium wilfordii]
MDVEKGGMGVEELDLLWFLFESWLVPLSSLNPNSDDIARLLAIGESRSFHGMTFSTNALSCQWSPLVHYSMGYYLAEGIYPSWDVERAFGVLQATFAIVRGPARYFKRSTLHDIMLASIILHNMIVEDERHLHVQPDIIDIYKQVEDGPPMPTLEQLRTNEFRNFVDQHIRIRDRETHTQLQTDLVEHS